MKPLLLVLFFCSGMACNSAETVVFLCDSTGARRYHLRRDCRGLKNCNYQLREVTINEAREKGKTRCGWEK